MSVMKQVKQAKVIGINKPGSLEDWMFYLWGEHKSITIEELLEAYARKEYEPIIEYNRQDVEYEFTLWLLVQYVLAQV